VAHQRCTVHKLRNLLAKAPKHTHEAVREDYHRIVYAETLAAAEKAREVFLLKWKKPCPGVAACPSPQSHPCRKWRHSFSRQREGVTQMRLRVFWERGYSLGGEPVRARVRLVYMRMGESN
jgi:hypothetical protein